MTIQSPLVYELYNVASSERHLHHCAAPPGTVPSSNRCVGVASGRCCAAVDRPTPRTVCGQYSP